MLLLNLIKDVNIYKMAESIIYIPWYNCDDLSSLAWHF